MPTPGHHQPLAVTVLRVVPLGRGRSGGGQSGWPGSGGGQGGWPGSGGGQVGGQAQGVARVGGQAQEVAWWVARQDSMGRSEEGDLFWPIRDGALVICEELGRSGWGRWGDGWGR